MDPMREIARQAIDQTPPAIRVSPEQAAVIAAHADELLALGPEIVQAFYDTLFAHEPTAEVFASTCTRMIERMNVPITQIMIVMNWRWSMFFQFMKEPPV